MANTKVPGKWVAVLAVTIAEEMRCKAMSSNKGNNVMFVGYEEDVAMCKHVFNFAVQFIRETSIKKSVDYRTQHGTAKGFRESYAYGFIKGLEEQYKENKKK